MPEKKQSSSEQQKNISSEKTAKHEAEVIAKLKRERDQYLADWQRARAELINYKKEEEKRFQQAIRFANERIIKELIFILDNFDLALQNIYKTKELAKKEEQILKGLILIKSQLEDLLRKEGVREIPAKKGERPKIEYQEIVSEIETDEVPEGTIGEVFQKGYIYNGKIIRPARVAVARSKNTSQELENKN